MSQLCQVQPIRPYKLGCLTKSTIQMIEYSQSKADDINNGSVGTFAGEYIEFYKNSRDEVQIIYDNQIAANVVTADLEASNGVIHVIDAVILR